MCLWYSGSQIGVFMYFQRVFLSDASLFGRFMSQHPVPVANDLAILRRNPCRTPAAEIPGCIMSSMDIRVAS